MTQERETFVDKRVAFPSDLKKHTVQAGRPELRAGRTALTTTLGLKPGDFTVCSPRPALHVAVLNKASIVGSLFMEPAAVLVAQPEKEIGVELLQPHHPIVSFFLDTADVRDVRSPGMPRILGAGVHPVVRETCAGGRRRGDLGPGRHIVEGFGCTFRFLPFLARSGRAGHHQGAAVAGLYRPEKLSCVSRKQLARTQGVPRVPHCTPSWMG